MDVENKKKGSPNFTPEEKTLLFTLVYEKKEVVENKKTDAVSSRSKLKCWEEITRKFNALSPGGFIRSLMCLQKFYSNKKKEARKEVANNKIYKKKTGGGPSQRKKEDPDTELLLATMNKYSVYGLRDDFGGDKSQNQDDHRDNGDGNDDTEENVRDEDNSFNNSENFVINDHTIENDTFEYLANDENNYQPKTKYRRIEVESDLQTTPVSAAASCSKVCQDIVQSIRFSQSVEKNKIQEKDTDWGNFTAEKLKKPKTAELITSSSRRRPVLKTLHSSTVSKSYDELAQKKMELVKKQLASQDKEEERKEVKFLLEKKCLELEIEIKLAYLEKLKNSKNLSKIAPSFM